MPYRKGHCIGILRLARAYTRASLRTTGRENIAINSEIACIGEKTTADKRRYRKAIRRRERLRSQLSSVHLHPISLSCKPCHLHAAEF
jgi:hypothetical protein